MAMHVSSGAARALDRDARCRVHSTFQHVMNILVGDDLVMLAPTGRHEALDCPFGIEISVADWVRIRSGLRSGSLATRWVWHRDQRRFTANGASVLAVTPLDGVDSIVAACSPHRVTPLPIDLRAATPPGTPEPGLLRHYGEPEVIARLRSATDALTGQGPLTDVLWLVGRGPGLTPSGDDALVGILAVLTMSEQVSHSALAELFRVLERDGVLLTTDVSRAYLLCAVRGEYSQSITDVMEALGEPDRLGSVVRRLVKHGHTSGIDVHLGMSVAVETLDYAKSA